jgi:hypothetical protein
MADKFPTSDSRPAVPDDDDAVAEDTTAEDAIAEPIVIRVLDRLETTHFSNPSGN